MKQQEILIKALINEIDRLQTELSSIIQQQTQETRETTIIDEDILNQSLPISPNQSIISLPSVSKVLSKKNCKSSIKTETNNLKNIHKYLWYDLEFDFKHFHTKCDDVIKALEIIFNGKDIQFGGGNQICNNLPNKAIRLLTIIVNTLKDMDIINEKYNELKLKYDNYKKEHKYDESEKKRDDNMSWDIIKNKYIELSKNIDLKKDTKYMYGSNKCFVIMSMYMELPPMRQNTFIKTKYLSEKIDMKELGKTFNLNPHYNYIDIDNGKYYVIKHKASKKHQNWGVLIYDLNKKHCDILKQWKLLQNNKIGFETQYLFCNHEGSKKGSQMTSSAVSKMLDRRGFANNIIRNYFIADEVNEMNNKDKNKYAKLMLHTPETQTFIYTKFRKNNN